MLEECLNVFEKLLNDNGMDWLLDNYIPKDGTYILVNLDKEFEVQSPLKIKTDKKTGEIVGKTNSNYCLISFLDYYSKLIEMNKPIDPAKTIHSNNIYSFFVKKDSILENKLTNDKIDKYYSILSNPIVKYEKSTKSKILYQKIQDTIGKVDNELASKIDIWIKANLNKVIEDNEIDVTKKDYLKIFFVYDDIKRTKEEIKKEGNRYILPNLYNSNDYTVVKDDLIYGLTGNNMGMNAKKPYLEKKSRKMKVPYLMESNRALLQSQFFDYLWSQACRGKYNIYVDLDKETIKSYANNESTPSMENGLFLRIQQDKNEACILYSDRVIAFSKRLKRTFYLSEIMEISDFIDKKKNVNYGSYTEIFEVEELIDDVYFGNRMRNNYFTKEDDISITDSNLKNIVLTYRESLWNWFRRGDTKAIKNVFDKLSIKVIRNSILNGYSNKIKHQFNLWISMSDYFNNDERREKEMNEVKEYLLQHIDDNNEWTFENDEQYFYAVGQLAQNYWRLIKSKKKDLSFINQILNSKKDEILKLKFATLHRKYGYAIEDKDYRLIRLINHVMMYKPTGKIREDIVLGGFTDNNVLFKSKKTGNETVEEK